MKGGPARPVSVFVSCLVDQVWPEVGVSMVRVLRRLGCEVHFDPRQTCCGQPAYNSGYRDEAAGLARRFIELYEAHPDRDIVIPSGSCTAMVHHYDDLLAEDEQWLERSHAVAARTFEFSDYLVTRLGVEDVGASFEGKVSWHDACHALRDLAVRDQPRRLLAGVRGLELVELKNSDACCGFGGTFSVKYPELSVAILDRKVEAIEHAGIDAVVSCDVSCLMHIGGRLSRRGSRVRSLHLAEVLASETGAPVGTHEVEP